MTARYDDLTGQTVNLTAAQERYLAAIRESGHRRYNGRARRTLEALEAAKLIACHWDMVPAHNMHGESTMWRITARANALDGLGNLQALEGADRCDCGCKYWENDRCIDCNTHAERIPLNRDGYRSPR